LISGERRSIQRGRCSKAGAYDRNLKTGAIQAHPAVKRMDALRRDYIKVLGLLGLRAAVSGGNPDEQDELSAILDDKPPQSSCIGTRTAKEQDTLD
jgi:hypothetical protein